MVSIFTAVYFCGEDKAGVTNRVFVALSQRTNILITMQLEVSSFDLFCDLSDFSSIMSAVRMGERSYFILHDGFLFKGN